MNGRYPITPSIRLVAVLLFALSFQSEAKDARALLGEKLFFDARLSANGSISCSTCHQPHLAFSDGKPVAQGIEDKLGSRNTPALLGVSRQKSFFWDGRRSTLDEQVKAPLINPLEHGFKDHAAVVRVVMSDRQYVDAFKRAFPQSPKPGIEEISQALVRYLSTLKLSDSPYLRAARGQTNALSAYARHGMRLFSDAGCATCHLVDGRAAELTDHRFHSLGIGLEPYREQLPVLAKRVMEADARELEGLIGSDRAIAELGRFIATKDPADIGKFKTPSLHNVAITAPYMHDGSIKTLAEAVDHELYYRGLSEGRPILLTADEKNALLAFLDALTGDAFRTASKP